jgi:hypothetical protein
MKNLYHSLLLLIAGSTQNELAAQIRYVLARGRSLPGRETVAVGPKLHCVLDKF